MHATGQQFVQGRFLLFPRFRIGEKHLILDQPTAKLFLRPYTTGKVNKEAGDIGS
jgi:hypothetical protein